MFNIINTHLRNRVSQHTLLDLGLWIIDVPTVFSIRKGHVNDSILITRLCINMIYRYSGITPGFARKDYKTVLPFCILQCVVFIFQVARTINITLFPSLTPITYEPNVSRCLISNSYININRSRSMILNGFPKLTHKGLFTFLSVFYFVTGFALINMSGEFLSTYGLDCSGLIYTLGILSILNGFYTFSLIFLPCTVGHSFLTVILAFMSLYYLALGILCLGFKMSFITSIFGVPVSNSIIGTASIILGYLQAIICVHFNKLFKW